jgi:hypothetical protein
MKTSNPKALGNIHTLNAPYFENQFFPESILLKSVIYYKYCAYDRALEAVSEFNTKFKPLRENLQGVVAKYEDNAEFYEYVKKIMAGKAGLDDTTQRLTMSVLGDKTLGKTFAWVDELDHELTMLGKADKAWQTTAVAGDINADLELVKSVAAADAGRLAKERLNRLVKELGISAATASRSASRCSTPRPARSAPSAPATRSRRPQAKTRSSSTTSTSSGASTASTGRTSSATTGSRSARSARSERGFFAKTLPRHSPGPPPETALNVSLSRVSSLTSVDVDPQIGQSPWRRPTEEHPMARSIRSYTTSLLALAAVGALAGAGCGRRDQVQAPDPGQGRRQDVRPGAALDAQGRRQAQGAVDQRRRRPRDPGRGRRDPPGADPALEGLIEETPDSDATEKADLYFRLAEMHSQLNRFHRLKSTEAAIKADSAKGGDKAKFQQAAKDNLAKAEAALKNAVGLQDAHRQRQVQELPADGSGAVRLRVLAPAGQVHEGGAADLQPAPRGLPAVEVRARGVPGVRRLLLRRRTSWPTPRPSTRRCCSSRSRRSTTTRTTCSAGST